MSALIALHILAVAVCIGAGVAITFGLLVWSRREEPTPDLDSDYPGAESMVDVVDNAGRRS